MSELPEMDARCATCKHAYADHVGLSKCGATKSNRSPQRLCTCRGFHRSDEWGKFFKAMWSLEVK